MPTENKVKTKSALKLVSALFAATLLLYVGLMIYSGSNTPHVIIGGQRVSVEVADDLSERQQGLSGRSNLADNEGMLFVFDRTDYYPFWMKDMVISIDMIWIDAKYELVHIERNVSPDTYPETVFTPSASSLYVLEVPAGWSDEHNITVGQFVEISI